MRRRFGCTLWIHRASVSCTISNAYMTLRGVLMGERLSVHVCPRVQTQALDLNPCYSHGGQRPRPRDPHTTANVGQKTDREGVEGT